MSRPNGFRSKVASIVKQIYRLYEKRKEPINIYELAILLNYNPEYFRRAILPAILAFDKCIELEGHSIKISEICLKETAEAVVQ